MANKKIFVRTNFRSYSKLGLKRKKLQKYRKGKGLDSKMRLGIKSHLARVRIGYRNMNKTRHLVKGLEPITIRNLEDLKKITKSQIGIVAKLGNRKRKEIAEYAIKNNIKLALNPKKTLEKIEKKIKEAKEEKIKRINKKLERDKKAKKEAEKKAKKEAKTEKVEATNKEEEINQVDNKEEDKETKVNEPENKIKPEKKQKEVKTNNYGRGK
ncbi:MAG: eL32 family ribosomal protein [Candidatus Pacearchaeota archaeon]